MVTEPISGATKDRVNDYLMRHKRYDNIDGTSEMFVGLMYLAFAIEGYITAALPQDTFYQKGLGQLGIMFGILIPMFCLGRWGSKAIKERITWPRTGYMAPRKVTLPSRVTIMLAAAGVTAGLALAFRFARSHAAVAQMIWITVFAAPYALCVYGLSKDHPWKRFVALFLAVSLLGYAIAKPEGSNKPVMVFTGIVWLASGGITLYLYIRRTQPPAPESE